jgi:hypothetical protein
VTLKRACAAACVGLALASSVARADAVDLKPADSKPAEEKPFFALSFGKLWVTPLIGPAYTPEMGLIIAGGILLSYRFDDDSPRSSMPIALSIGSVGSRSFTAKPELYLLEDRLRIGMYFGVKGMNDNYFGVGYEKGNTTPLGVDTTQYYRDFLQFNGQILWQLRENLYFGGNFDLSQTDASQLNANMSNDELITRQGTYFLNTGVGPILRYDSRDTPENAFKGVYFQAQFLFYRPGILLNKK